MTEEKIIKRQSIYIVVGSNPFAFWVDRKMAKLLEWSIGRERTNILSVRELNLRRKHSKTPVIVIGGPDANDIATEICEMHPVPLYIQIKGRREIFFIHGGMRKNGEGYDVFDTCLAIWGRRVRDTIYAMKYCLSEDGQKIIQAFANYDWSQLPESKDAKWKTKYWDIPEIKEDERLEYSTIPRGVSTVAEGNISYQAQKRKVDGISDLEKVKIIIENDLHGKMRIDESASGTNKLKIKEIYENKYNQVLTDNKLRSYLSTLGYTKSRG